MQNQSNLMYELIRIEWPNVKSSTQEGLSKGKKLRGKKGVKCVTDKSPTSEKRWEGPELISDVTAHTIKSAFFE